MANYNWTGSLVQQAYTIITSQTKLSSFNHTVYTEKIKLRSYTVINRKETYARNYSIPIYKFCFAAGLRR